LARGYIVWEGWYVQARDEESTRPSSKIHVHDDEARQAVADGVATARAANSLSPGRNYEILQQELAR
jgi:hypothetical protein